MLVAQGNLDEALQSYQAALAIMERLAKADPSNTEWQSDLSVSYDRTGDVLVAQEKPDEALEIYRKSLAVRERLAASDPSNTRWQRDLSVSYQKVGNVLVPQETINWTRRSKAIARRPRRSPSASPLPIPATPSGSAIWLAATFTWRGFILNWVTPRRHWCSCIREETLLLGLSRSRRTTRNGRMTSPGLMTRSPGLKLQNGIPVQTEVLI